jgi:hypothetical protein
VTSVHTTEINSDGRVMSENLRWKAEFVMLNQQQLWCRNISF